jgi:hypothetical protein
MFFSFLFISSYFSDVLFPIFLFLINLACTFCFDLYALAFAKDDALLKVRAPSPTGKTQFCWNLKDYVMIKNSCHTSVYHLNVDNCPKGSDYS